MYRWSSAMVLVHQESDLPKPPELKGSAKIAVSVTVSLAAVALFIIGFIFCRRRMHARISKRLVNNTEYHSGEPPQPFASNGAGEQPATELKPTSEYELEPTSLPLTGFNNKRESVYELPDPQEPVSNNRSAYGLPPVIRAHARHEIDKAMLSLATDTTSPSTAESSSQASPHEIRLPPTPPSAARTEACSSGSQSVSELVDIGLRELTYDTRSPPEVVEPLRLGQMTKVDRNVPLVAIDEDRRQLRAPLVDIAGAESGNAAGSARLPPQPRIA